MADNRKLPCNTASGSDCCLSLSAPQPEASPAVHQRRITQAWLQYILFGSVTIRGIFISWPWKAGKGWNKALTGMLTDRADSSVCLVLLHREHFRAWAVLCSQKASCIKFASVRAEDTFAFGERHRPILSCPCKKKKKVILGCSATFHHKQILLKNCGNEILQHHVGCICYSL